MTLCSPQILVDLLKSHSVVEFNDIRAALGGASPATVFRYLRQVPYRSSYNYNGRFYTLHEPSRYDHLGLFRHGDIFFSRDGTLKLTVRRVIWESEAGMTQRELQELLHVRVQSFLKALVEEKEIGRERIEGIYHYLHTQLEIQRAQLQHRFSLITEAKEKQAALDDKVIIRVLLTLIRYPGAKSEEVVRHLRGFSPPIILSQVNAVFTRYNIGEKGGPTIF